MGAWGYYSFENDSTHDAFNDSNSVFVRSSLGLNWNKQVITLEKTLDHMTENKIVSSEIYTTAMKYYRKHVNKESPHIFAGIVLIGVHGKCDIVKNDIPTAIKYLEDELRDKKKLDTWQEPQKRIKAINEELTYLSEKK